MGKQEEDRITMVMNDNDSSWVAQRAQEMINRLESEYTRPSVMFKPRVFKSGPLWYAHYGGANFSGEPESGVTAYGSTPDEAMRNFDKLWLEKPKST